MVFCDMLNNSYHCSQRQNGFYWTCYSFLWNLGRKSNDFGQISMRKLFRSKQSAMWPGNKASCSDIKTWDGTLQGERRSQIQSTLCPLILCLSNHKILNADIVLDWDIFWLLSLAITRFKRRSRWFSIIAYYYSNPGFFSELLAHSAH